MSKKASLIDSEAEVETDDEVDNLSNVISEDEDEEGLDQDLEGFVVGDDVEEKDKASQDDNSESDVEAGDPFPKKKRRRRHSSDKELLDEDYDLLEENLGVKMKRKKFSRVRVASSDEEEDEGKEDDRMQLAKQLFESDEDEAELPQAGITDDVGVRKRTIEPDDSEGESDTEVDDFIVDDKGRPVKRQDRSHYGYGDSALREAEEIFGDGFDMEKIGEELKDDELDDDDEYDYDDDDDFDERKKKKRGQKAEVDFYKIYEPVDLEKGHFTVQDQVIKMTDLPERFQLRSIPVSLADDKELEEEATWIFKHAFNSKPVTYQGEVDEFGQIMMWEPKPASAEARIKGVLKLIRNDNYEVPFVGTYRKEIIQDELSMSDLWTIWEWDEKWMRQKKSLYKLREQMMKVQQRQFERTQESKFLKSERIVEAEDTERVEHVQTAEEFSDIEAHFSHYYHKDVVDMQNQSIANATLDGLGTADQCKQRYKHNKYLTCEKANLGNLANNFGLTASQFAENLSEQYNKHTVGQLALMPEEAAKEFECRTFPTPTRVLEGARYMLAKQIAVEPSVRAAVRQAFYERALLTIKPTKEGIRKIDETHPCANFKYIKDKPVRDLAGEEFLRMHGAEKEGLIQMSLSVDKHGSKDTYLEEIKTFFYRDEFSQLVQSWNEQRMIILNYTLNNLLYPVLAEQLKRKMLEESTLHVLKKCKVKLRNCTQMAPYAVENMDESGNNGVRILGFCIRDAGEDKPGYGILINGAGAVEETITLSYFKYSSKGNTELAKKKEADMEKLREFLLEHKPHVVGLGCEGRALQYQREIQDVITSLEQQHQIDPITIELVDPTVSRIYKESNRAQVEFPNYTPEQRMAVSIARRLRDPLVEFTQLMNFSNDVLSIPWHSLQRFINEERLLRWLTQEFVTLVNNVGVDLNFAVEHYHYQNMVQFVCGLGPRKAAALLKCGAHTTERRKYFALLRAQPHLRVSFIRIFQLLKQHTEHLESRALLVQEFKLGSRVFLNCAGFIKVQHSREDSLSDNFQLLDSTRIHPETYIWAEKMAIDALEYDEDDEDDNNVKQRALEEIMDDPEKLLDLDLDAFNTELKRQEYPDKRITLYDIRDELTNRFADKRSPYHGLTDEEKFYLLSNESAEGFKEGSIVQCVVVGIARRKPKGDEPDIQPKRNEATGMWQCPLCLRDEFPELSEIWNHFDTSGSCPGQAVGVRVRLNNGISGFIATKNLSDQKVTNPEERVKIGKQIDAKVLRVNFEKVSVDLTCKTSDLNNTDEKNRDLYYDTEAADQEKKAKEAKKNKNKKVNQYINRVIVHPYFKNITYTECERLLRNKEQGAAIIRPSRKGTDVLTLTVKIDQVNNILSHTEIQEEDKDNQFSLGRKLKIGDEEFEDLDEVVTRYAEPMAANAREIIGYKYFKDAIPKETMNTILRNDKALTPKRLPYYITTCKDRPGKFLLSYMPRSSPVHESVTVTHNGYRFRGKLHETPFPSFIAWFKQHWSEAPPVTASKAVSAAGAKSVATDYTADFTDFTEPFQTPRSSGFSDVHSAVGSTYTNMSHHKSPARTPAHRTPSHRTPSHATPGARTPSHAGTPGGDPYGSRTPGGYGSRTPGGHHGGSRTPGYVTPKTPGSSSRTPSYNPGGRTPGHAPSGSRTPGYPPHPAHTAPPGARTPGHATPGYYTPGGSYKPHSGYHSNRTPAYHHPHHPSPHPHHPPPHHHHPSPHHHPPPHSGYPAPGSRTPGNRTPGSRTPGNRPPSGVSPRA